METTLRILQILGISVFIPLREVRSNIIDKAYSHIKENQEETIIAIMLISELGTKRAIDFILDKIKNCDCNPEINTIQQIKIPENVKLKIRLLCICYLYIIIDFEIT